MLVEREDSVVSTFVITVDEDCLPELLLVLSGVDVDDVREELNDSRLGDECIDTSIAFVVPAVLPRVCVVDSGAKERVEVVKAVAVVPSGMMLVVSNCSVEVGSITVDPISEAIPDNMKLWLDEDEMGSTMLVVGISIVVDEEVLSLTSAESVDTSVGIRSVLSKTEVVIADVVSSWPLTELVGSSAAVVVVVSSSLVVTTKSSVVVIVSSSVDVDSGETTGGVPVGT